MFRSSPRTTTSGSSRVEQVGMSAVVERFSGGKSLKAIGEFLTHRRVTVSLFYVSNVEYYLFQQAAFRKFADNLRAVQMEPRWADRQKLLWRHLWTSAPESA